MKLTQQQADYLVSIIIKWYEVYFKNYQNPLTQSQITGAVDTLLFIVKDIITVDPSGVVEV